MSETPRFITIDADNIVHDDFFNVELDMDKVGESHVISWAGKNMVNGLVYGNGGIKCWPVHVVNGMRTHEAAPEGDKAAQVDFCWNIHYVQMNNIYCDVHNNGSAYQAYRAGFREGCKMSLENGDVVDKNALKKVHRRNYQRMLVWMSVGVDALNGLWAVYGARLGCYMTNLEREDWDWRDVRDFEWHTKFFKEHVMPQFADDDGDSICVATGYKYDSVKLKEETLRLGRIIQDELDLEIADMDKKASRFFKEVYINPSRLGAQVREDLVDDSIG